MGRDKGYGRVRIWGLSPSPTDIFGSKSLEVTPCLDRIQSLVDEKVQMQMNELEKQHAERMNELEKQQKELEKQQKEKLESLEKTQRELNLIIEMYRNGMDKDGVPHPGSTPLTPSSVGQVATNGSSVELDILSPTASNSEMRKN